MGAASRTPEAQLARAPRRAGKISAEAERAAAAAGWATSAGALLLALALSAGAASAGQQKLAPGAALLQGSFGSPDKQRTVQQQQQHANQNQNQNQNQNFKEENMAKIKKLERLFAMASSAEAKNSSERHAETTSAQASAGAGSRTSKQKKRQNSGPPEPRARLAAAEANNGAETEPSLTTEDFASGFDVSGPANAPGALAGSSTRSPAMDQMSQMSAMGQLSPMSPMSPMSQMGQMGQMSPMNGMPAPMSPMAAMADQMPAMPQPTPASAPAARELYGRVGAAGSYHLVAEGGDEFGPPPPPAEQLPQRYLQQVEPHQQLAAKQASGSHIRVVFNNNPQFIIGRHADAALAPAHVRGGGAGHGTYTDHDYSAAESQLDETKVTPCARERGSPAGLPRNMEQISLGGPLDEPAAAGEPPADKVEQSQVRTPGSPAPPAPAQQQPLPQASRPVDGQEVNVPLRELVKSGARPPLRMIISMRNKDGEVLKMPINLHGDSQHALAAKPHSQMRIHFEPETSGGGGAALQPPGQTQVQLSVPADENTPLGGDMFDPALVKPFPKARMRPRDEPRKPPSLDKGPEVAPVDALAPPSPPSPPRQAPKHRPPMAALPEEVQPQLQVGEPAPEPMLEPAQFKVPLEPAGGAQKSDCNRKTAHGSSAPVAQAAPVMAAALETEDEAAPSLFKNRTLAGMFAEFQRALSEQMEQMKSPARPTLAARQLSQPESNAAARQSLPVAAMASRQRALADQEREARRLQQQRLQDQEEDLFVGAMVANASSPGSMEAGRQIAMTVITPPRGTSLEQAIRAHAGDSQDSQRAVAILHGRASGAGDEQFAQPFPVSVQLRPRQLATMQQVDSAADDPSDGFAAAASSGLDWGAAVAALNSAAATTTFRYRRQAAASDYGPSLEPADRLRPPAELARLAPNETRPANSTELGVAAALPLTPSNQTSGLDSIVGAASDQNEVDASDSDGDSSMDEEPAESDMDSRADTDMLDDSGESDMDDNPDETAGFDSDDEPYNQGSSSDGQASFEIPQIELKPESLKQERGCRTVLREVHEIPLNGLGVVRADGSPGSGYAPAAGGQPQVRVRRQAPPTKSALNSRKVTSIVMTKECHFPDGGQPADTEPKEPGEPAAAVRVAPGSEVVGLRLAERREREREPQARVAGAANGAPIQRRSLPDAASDRDFYVVSDSRRNEVAQKLYKPPSDADPYHSLVYVSRNGVDPDSEPDVDEEAAAAARSSGGRRSAAVSSRRQMSPRERQALLDPDHDDTDPPLPDRDASERGDEPDEPDDDESDEQAAAASSVPGSARRGRHSSRRLRVQHQVGGAAPSVARLEQRADSGRPSAADARAADADSEADDPDSEPDADPDYNPKETRMAAAAAAGRGKPRRYAKSFAYVHRDNGASTGSGGAAGQRRPADDFVVTYGRGHVQSEHEDYDSERDHSPPPSSMRTRRSGQAAGAAPPKTPADHSKAAQPNTGVGLRAGGGGGGGAR